MNNTTYTIAGAIIVAGALIALAITFTGNTAPNEERKLPVRDQQAQDHIYGNTDATISLIEYSDFECPFCARIHPTLKTIVDDSQGEINWIYRHFPLSNIHSRAVEAAIASECIAKHAGNDGFWLFADSVFLGDQSLGDALYLSAAQKAGIDEPTFTTCMANQDQFRGRIQGDLEEVISAGGDATPYTVVVNNETGAFRAFTGALEEYYIRGVIRSVREE